MILSVIQHAGALSARPRQYRQRATLMYDAITELIKASSRNTDPVVGLGGGGVGGAEEAVWRAPVRQAAACRLDSIIAS